MKPVYRLLPLLPVFVLFGCQHPAPAPAPATAPALTNLRSPWDSTPVELTDAPFTCAPAPAIGPDITISGPLNDDSHHVSEDVKNAVLGESSAGLETLTALTVHAADTYRSTGSRIAAQCAIDYLYAAASNHAMTGYLASDDARWEQNIALRSFAIALLKVRGSNLETAQNVTVINQWMEGIVRAERSYWEHGHCGVNVCDIKDHRGLQTAMAAAAIAVLADDPGLFHWSVAQFHSAAGEINGRGFLHYDTRTKYAFKWNLESAASMAQIAELAEVNGEPLYNYDNGIFHLLVHTVALGIVSPEPYKSYTGRGQKHSSTVEPWEIAWASVYNRRFPDPVVTSLLQQIGPGGVDMWGGEPWDPEGDPGPEN